MGVLEDAKVKRSGNKIPANDPRILEAEEKVFWITQTPCSVYFKDISINEKGFYNSEYSEGDICIPKKAAELKDDELFALILSEFLFSVNSEKQIRRIGRIYGWAAVCGIVIILLLSFFAASTMNLNQAALSLFMDFFFSIKLYSGNNYSNIPLIIALIWIIAFMVFRLPITYYLKSPYRADKRTVKETGNKQALINALRFMRSNESDENKRQIINKRIWRLDTAIKRG